MICSRLSHYVYVLPQDPSKMTRCCAMTHQPKFDTLEAMEADQYYTDIAQTLASNKWPKECIRCQTNEALSGTSARISSNLSAERYVTTRPDYLNVSISEGSKCNAACQICNAESSSLYAKTFNIKSTNSTSSLPLLKNLAPARIKFLSISGGEPALTQTVIDFLLTDVSKYQLDSLALTSNGTRVIPNIEIPLSSGMKVTVVLSMDGTKSIFEYSRWPIKWNNFIDTLEEYVALRTQYPNLTLTIIPSLSALNVFDYANVLQVVKKYNLILWRSSVQHPSILQFSNTNILTTQAKELLRQSDDSEARALSEFVAIEENDSTLQLMEFIHKGDAARGIQINNYLTESGITI